MLDLQQAFEEVYRRSAYALSVNYDKEPPPPKFSDEDVQWLRELVSTLTQQEQA